MQPLLKWKSNKFYVIWVCVRSFRYLDEMCMSHVVTCGLSGSKYFPYYHINGTIFEKNKKVTEHKTCVSIFSTTSVRNILRKTERDVVQTVYWSASQVTVIIVTFHLDLNFLNSFFEKWSNIKFMKIHPVETELFHAEGKMGRHDEVNSCFLQFYEETKMTLMSHKE